MAGLFNLGRYLGDRLRGQKKAMRFGKCLRTAAVSLRTHKLRSVLTVLGVVIGVSAVVLVWALGAGARMMVAKQISGAGAGLLMIVSGATSKGGWRLALGTAPSLTTGDAQAIGKEILEVDEAVPVWGDVAQVVLGSRNWSTMILGTTPEFAPLRRMEMLAGRFINVSESHRGAKVCILGFTVAQNLCGVQYPLGQTLRINNIPFVLIGVMAPKGRTPDGRDQDDMILMPLETAQKSLFGTALPGVVKFILVSVFDPSKLASAQAKIDALLSQRHRFRPGQEKDFSIRNLTEILQTWEVTINTMTWLLWGVAFISLLVGGIGIMNIMLVSVKERTPEIGLRMAVGANPADIMLQFLTEAVVLSMSGGLIGLLFGAAAAKLIGRLLGWPICFSLLPAMAAMLISMAVGISFGFFPARQAARLHPMDTLRYG
jgi:putative ABC transport system permease protein